MELELHDPMCLLGEQRDKIFLSLLSFPNILTSLLFLGKFIYSFEVSYAPFVHATGRMNRHKPLTFLRLLF